jgi:hypothetical protein
LTSRFNGGPPKDEPLNQWVPLIEFRFDSPRGQYTAATVNPGFAYVAVAWQIAAEAIIPLNRAGGNSTGFRAELLFFLDDLIPSVFGTRSSAISPREVKSHGDLRGYECNRGAGIAGLFVCLLSASRLAARSNFDFKANLHDLSG